MKSAWWGVGGMGLGVGLMYWADPRNGRWRRAHLQGRAVHAAHEAGGAVGIVARDLSHRTRGVFHESLQTLRTCPVDDLTLEERVRAALGRVCSHPGAVRVSAHEGVVVLEGSILLDEVKRVVPRIGRVRDHIEERLADPDLRPATIAAAHAISVRALYQLFERRGATVSGYVRRRRLARARAELARLGPATTVAGTAHRWGFADQAGFSRAFRREYGCPPNAVRLGRG